MSRKAIFLKTKIVGTGFRGISAQVRLARLVDQERVDLYREPDNQFDKNAIAVYSIDNAPNEPPDGTMLGYIPKAKNADLARQMDEGIQVCGFWEEDGEVVRVESIPDVIEN
jgi:hypothetical protein